jgi:probable F420-dependent oxidoreductase
MPDSMKIGLFAGFGVFAAAAGPRSASEQAARVAQIAEEVGFDSIWMGEHVVLPDPRVPPSPMDRDDPILDPIVALTFLAAHTRTIRLGTGIIILPQRNPLVLAKELASLDVLSGGRLIVGVGAGYLEPEFRALGIPFEHRGPRTVEYLDAMRAIWASPQPAYDGRFVSFAGVQARPRPVQQPHPPIVMGGNSPPAYRRAVLSANGWYGYALDLETAAHAIAGLRRAAERYQRPAELGELEISITPRGVVDPTTVAQYAALGVHRLILLPRGARDGDAVERFVAETGRTLIPRA